MKRTSRKWSWLQLAWAVTILAAAGPAVLPLSIAWAGGEQVFTMSPDQPLVIWLESNLSTGYQWQWVERSGGLLAQFGESQFQRPHSELLGGGERQALRFVARRAGEEQLILVYRRPWEAAAPLRTMRLAVRAAGAYQGPPASVPAQTDNGMIISSDGQESRSSATGLPPAMDWCQRVGCQPVRDQGSCGSCWAFGTVAAFEMNLKIRNGVDLDLSEQYLVSCNVDGWGCTGGRWAHDYHLNKHSSKEPDAGAVYEIDEPYLAYQPACQPPHPHHEKIEGWAYVDESVAEPTVEQIKQAISTYGPVAATVCTGPAFNAYTGGSFRTDEGSLCPEYNDHAIVLVGWDDAEQVWILRNSWGPGWGDNGYMRIGYGISNVGARASYVEYKVGVVIEPVPTPTPPPVPTPSPTPRPDLPVKLYLPILQEN